MRRGQPAQSGKMGFPDCGNSLALQKEVTIMWHLPIRITLEVKRTRTSWSIAIRVQFGPF
jgi:hypothetical protein